LLKIGSKKYCRFIASSQFGKLSSFWTPRKAELVKPVKTRQGGSSERGRVSEYLKESPRLLARPLPPKSWDVSRRAGKSSRKGFVG